MGKGIKCDMFANNETFAVSNCKKSQFSKPLCTGTLLIFFNLLIAFYIVLISLLLYTAKLKWFGVFVCLGFSLFIWLGLVWFGFLGVLDFLSFKPYVL